MEKNKTEPQVMKMCVAITTDDFQRLSEFYRVGLGLEPTEDWGDEGGRNYVVEMGTAIFEVVDEKQANTLDQIEVGERVSGKLRFALEVPNLDAAVNRLVEYGAKMIQSPKEVPWGDRIARFIDPEGIHLTFFERKK
ncbi:MAG: VOC family protein [Spirochaetes bacterium]|nr:VOC family protein [Spirochaetota bacterium]MBN2770269.1 VOC family protein [Spirochaetota bacterium]